MAGSLNAGSIVYEVDMDTAKLIAARREVDAALNGMGASMGRLEASVTRTERSIASIEDSFTSLTSVAKGVFAALSIQQVGAYAQAWQDLSNKLSNAVKESVPPFETLADVTERVFNIAQRTRSGLESTAELYARLERSTRSYGVSVENLTKLTTIINQGFIVSGASAEEASNAITQLAQGLASGALRGDEFNSVNEQGNRLMIALADSMGVGIGELRNMAAQGKLTTDVIVSGLLSQGDSIAKEFAKTTTTLGQSLEIAGNNITKFFGENSTVKTGVNVFSSGVITMSENVGALSSALTAIALVMGGRFVGALAMSAAAKVKDTAATIASNKASAVAAKDAELEAGAKLRLAEANKVAAVTELDHAERRLASIKSTNAANVAEVRLAEAELASVKTSIALLDSEKALEAQRLRSQITDQGRIASATRMAQLQQASAALNTRLAAAEVATSQARATAISAAEAQVSTARLATADATGIASAANGVYTASQEATVIANRAASASMALLKTSFALIGGPAGAIMIAAAGLYFWWQKTQQAKQEAIAFADGLDKINESMKSLSNTSLRGTIADANTSIRAQKESVADLQSEVDKLQGQYQSFTPEAQKVANSMGQGTGFAARQSIVADELAKKTRDLHNAKDKLSKTEDTASEATRTLTNNMLTSMGMHDSLIEKGTTLERVQGAVAKAFGNTADEVNRANQAQQNYNPKSMQVAPATPKGDEAILDLEQRNELLKIQDERLRAVTKAGMEQAKVTNNPNQIEAAKRLAGENYDLQQAEDARKKAASDAESQSKRSASSAESVAQKLAKLKEQSELAAESTQELTREKAILNAQQSLGKGATDNDIRQAGEYAAKTFDSAKAVRDLAQAEQGRKFATQEISSAAVMPDAQTGAVLNPTAEIDLREQQKLEALAKYQAIDLQNAQLYEDAKTSIQEQAANARQQIAVNEANMQSQAISSIVGSVSQGFDGLANLAAGAAGKSSGAYQAMFALSKGFAVAQSALNLQLAISQAMADPTALTPAQKLANYAAIAGAGASLLSTIGSISYGGGRKNGGPVSAGSMYQVGENGMPEIYQASTGKQYMIPGDNGKVISNKDIGGEVSSGGMIQQINNFTFNNASGDQQEMVTTFAKIAYEQSLRAIKDQKRPGGMLTK